jgi:hypothetical protein
MSTETTFGTMAGGVFGYPELGHILGEVNTASKAINDLTEGVPVVGDVVNAVDEGLDVIKDIPGIGDVIDLFI